MGSGRGEELAPVLARGTYHWVFAISEGGLSTPAVYAECDRLRRGRAVTEPRPSRRDDAGAAQRGRARARAALTNDLQRAPHLAAPEPGDILEAGLEFGALGGIVSGSGPTVAFLVTDNEAALDLAVSLTASGTVRDVRRARRAGHGARVRDLAAATRGCADASRWPTSSPSSAPPLRSAPRGPRRRLARRQQPAPASASSAATAAASRRCCGCSPASRRWTRAA